jgi:hypothetical protein
MLAGLFAFIFLMPWRLDALLRADVFDASNPI